MHDPSAAAEAVVCWYYSLQPENHPSAEQV